MPREYVYAQYLTVRDGDLPIPPPPTTETERLLLDGLTHVNDRVGQLRRQLDVHDAFVNAARGVLGSLSTDADDATHGELRAAVRDLRRLLAELDDSLAHDAEPTSTTRTTRTTRSTSDAVDAINYAYAGLVRRRGADADDATQRLQLRVSLGWEPGGREVVLGVDAETSDGTPVDLGGLRASLDWHATNLLVAAARTARDGANGTPA